MNNQPMIANHSKIMIVDDSIDNLRVLSATLHNRGYDIRCAKSGSMAVIGACADPPDLILLDIRMPDMTGYEVCQELKKDDKTKEIPVIFLSALDDASDKVKAFKSGGVDYVTKPFQVEEVLARIKNHLELQIAKTEIQILNAELEQRVRQRTEQLEISNQKLRQEIAERQQAERLLQESEERLENILNSLEEAVWSASYPTFKYQYINPAAERIYGRPVADFFNQPNLWLEVIHPGDRTRVEKAVASLYEHKKLDLEYRILRPDGEIRWVRNRSYLICSSLGNPVRIDGIVYDVTDQKRAENKLIYAALHDALTGLPNRNLFMERLELALKRIKRHKETCFAVLFVDLDRFKLINDTLGHSIGDQFLIEISLVLQQCIQSTDCLARFGGDEFVILLEDIASIDHAKAVAAEILEKLAQPFLVSNHAVFTGASIGIVLASHDYDDCSMIVRDADIAMYHAKEAGKGCYQVFEKKMYLQTLKFSELERDLRQAIENQEFVIYYQPIICLANSQVAGFEALLRWKHPKRGLITPEEFIAIAEDTGLIIPIGEWVLREVCEQLRCWQLQFSALSHLWVSINIAIKQLMESNFLKKVDRVLEKTCVNRRSLRFEITETSLMNYAEDTIKLLQEIRSRGIQLSIDDFGKGYSSLGYLHRFPINVIKIDRSFITQEQPDNDGREIVQTIITLANSLGMNTVAEGIETVSQFHYLRSLGCTYGQGYFFDKPLPADQVLKKLKKIASSLI